MTTHEFIPYDVAIMGGRPAERDSMIRVVSTSGWPIVYPKPDSLFSFDKLSSVSLSNITRDEDQSIDLTLKEPGVPTTVNLSFDAGPERRYCPTEGGGGPSYPNM